MTQPEADWEWLRSGYGGDPATTHAVSTISRLTWWVWWVHVRDRHATCSNVVAVTVWGTRKRAERVARRMLARHKVARP